MRTKVCTNCSQYIYVYLVAMLVKSIHTIRLNTRFLNGYSEPSLITGMDSFKLYHTSIRPPSFV